MDKLTRLKPLFAHNLPKLQRAKVLLLGVGGVGGFCLDGLYKTGIEDVTIVDFDYFDPTNQNRQIGSENVGEIKVEVLKKLYPNITPIHQKVTREWIEKMDFSAFNVVIDAIDDMSAKVQLALHVNVPLISSMGSAKKLDPTQIQFCSIWETKGDPLARKFRYELRKAGFDGDFDVVYSQEESKCKELGSFVGVTGSFGLALSALALQKILG